MLHQTTLTPAVQPVPYSNGAMVEAISAELGKLPAATREATLDDLAAPTSVDQRWSDGTSRLALVASKLAERGLDDDTVDTLANEEMDATNALIALPSRNAADAIAKVRMLSKLGTMVDANALAPLIDELEGFTPPPTKPAPYGTYMRGPLIQWQRAYARYADAADALTVFDRDEHTPAVLQWNQAKLASGDGSDPVAVSNEAAAWAHLELTQEGYDNLCSTRYDALDELLRIPAPGPGELAIKLRLYSEDYRWEEGQQAAGEVMTIDARRFGRLGALVQTDQPLLDAFAEYRDRYRDLRALPDDVSISDEDACFARMDEAGEPLCTTRATTIEGVIARLRFGLHGVNHDAYMPDVVLDPGSHRFKTGMPLADLSVRMIWQSIEDLARLAGVSLTEEAA